MVKLSDALLGTGAGPVDIAMNRKSRADEGTFHGLGRSVGAEATIDWPSTREALGRHLAVIASDAMSNCAGTEFEPYLQRIRERARK